MRDTALEQALSAFLAAPERGVDGLLNACGPFVTDQARFWQKSRISFADRCREILTELFLILIEDIRTERAARPESVLSYLSLRLRRLTRPYPSKTTPFGLADDLPDCGRCDFTPLRLELVRELAECTRSALLHDPHETTRGIEFLFIHIAPDLASASRFLAVTAGASPEARIEADKKRHQAFTRQLRSRFESMKSGDWREVTNWSGGERSHLAWRLISFTRCERSGLGEPLAAALDGWREDQQPYRPEATRAALVTPAIGALAGMYPPPAGVGIPRVSVAAEPAAPYGDVMDLDPLAEMLLPGRLSRGGQERKAPVHLRQAASHYGDAPIRTMPGTGSRLPDIPAETGADSGEAAAEAYLEAVNSVRAWFGKISGSLRKT